MKEELIRLLKIPLYLFGVVVLAMLFLGARAYFTLPDLEPWHEARQGQEDFAYARYEKFADYLVDEKKVLEGVYAVMGTDEVTANKYARQSTRSPYVNGENLNASFEMPPKSNSLAGGVLLVHGLSDSPYHMRAVAEVFSAKGYYVLGLRLPGHGTVPGALVNVQWEDWYKAVDFAARMVQEKIEANNEAKFIVGGFSTGGALTLRYTLQAVLADDPNAPDQLFLFSPAIAVTPKTMLANWHKLVAWLPYYEKFRWDEIEDEDDPFKYNSFPKNAADQIRLLTKANFALADKVRDDEKLRKKMPPIIAFQSPVDATVKADALLELFKKIGNSESELVWFDVNHFYLDSVKADKREVLPNEKSIGPDFNSRLLIVTNKESRPLPASYASLYEAKRRPNEKNFTLVKMESKALAWPEKAFALSHVCIPISPTDEFYGERSELGGIAANENIMVGEVEVLAVGSEGFKRIRYNPFFDFVKERIESAFSQGAARENRQ